MQPRTYQQIYDELGSTYDPQVNLYRQQQNEIPGQLQAEEQGLAAKQTQAFDEILGGARQRGLGFSGIPIGEQAKYNATQYMPALANLRTATKQRATDLESAILQIMQGRQQQAQGVFDNERNLAEQQRQFNENLNFQRQQLAASQKAASGGGFATPTFSPSVATPGTAPVANKQPALTGGKTLNDAVSALQGLLSTKNSGVIRNTITAIASSAAKGNTYDQAKLQLINSRPEFGQYLANFNGAKF